MQETLAKAFAKHGVADSRGLASLAVSELVALLGGQQVYIPLNAADKSREKRKAIRLLKGKASASSVAIRYQCSVQHVYSVWRDA